ncbi:putative pentatricopeptide repeat-containing protein At4g17915 isoform X3 [Ziziphus jujuba]|uniref:Pentatricopeptide repeat-containing protein At4g17915 isoform X3 n=1 Tax=Ziziphus jujuba TaxID=326968 RepID=A0ABM4A7H5_ZIZJJ|nr:putative pentatricopeptide repeat-containing protein At4g17915 isoform X3 [Ziziphus jujuba]
MHLGGHRTDGSSRKRFPFLSRLLRFVFIGKLSQVMYIRVKKLSTRLLNICVASLCKAKQLGKAEAVIVDGVRLGILPDVVTYNTLIDAYCRFVGLDAAYSILYRMKEAGISPDVITYNSLMAGATRKRLLKQSLDLFDYMLREGRLHTARGIIKELQESGPEPNAITYNIMLKFYFRSKQYDQGLQLMSEIRSKGFTFDGFAYCTVMSALIKTGRIKEANACAEQMMNNGIELDLVSYNTLMYLYCKECNFGAAFKLLDEIQKGGLECDQYTHTILISGLCKAGHIVEAQQHFNKMNSLGFSNLAALNCLIDGLCKHGRIDQAMELFEAMEIKDSITYTSLVHNLCKARRFLCASKLMLTCFRGGMRVLRCTQRAVLDGLRNSGFRNEARKLQSKIQLARMLN